MQMPSQPQIIHQPMVPMHPASQQQNIMQQQQQQMVPNVAGPALHQPPPTMNRGYYMNDYQR
jgi:hypothetical protein